MQAHTVTFTSNNLSIAAHLYLPPGEGPHPAIIVGHPGSSVKEQSAGLYARRLAEQGFATLAYDAAYQGESGGWPRGLEDPAQRVEDIKAAASYLSARADIDPQRIGALGICASGGYVVAAAAADHRLAAVATVAAVDVGRNLAHGANGQQDPAVLQALLDGAAAARSAEARGEETGYFPIFPADEAQARSGDLHLYEGWEYYCTPRGEHPRARKTLTWSSVDRIAGFDAFRFIERIAPRPLLMITASAAVTAWMTEAAIESARAPKQLHRIEGATHVELYDKEPHVSAAIAKLTDFFTRELSRVKE
ncbi:alpha/beta hydrolase [Duganella sp. FT80W]|uniref:Alpha/beta hydrolase n=1 Tax=Duganella guangzhouensis TaxID=2666084 RepID=A0A6I2L6M9_9BURK|nr:alpha/beta hydrolase [Duganella guangzhouensis]MRW92534.1 alpha/beta hydrolase [Duganella guangzhouensis]